MNRPREPVEEFKKDKKSEPNEFMIEITELKKYVDDLSTQINAYNNGKKVEIIKTSTLKNFIKDIVDKKISTEEDILNGLEPFMKEHNRIIKYNTIKKEPNQKKCTKYIKKLYDLISKEPLRSKDKQEPSGSKDISDFDTDETKEVDLDWIYGTKKQLEGLMKKFDKVNMIKYKDTKGNPTKTLIQKT